MCTRSTCMSRNGRKRSERQGRGARAPDALPVRGTRALHGNEINQKKNLGQRWLLLLRFSLFQFDPQMVHGVGKDQLLAGPAVEDYRAVGVLRHEGVAVRLTRAETFAVSSTERWSRRVWSKWASTLCGTLMSSKRQNYFHHQVNEAYSIFHPNDHYGYIASIKNGQPII